MADFIIKSAAGTGNKTLIQGQDQSSSNYAIQVGDAGATTLTNATLTTATMTAGTIASAVSLNHDAEKYAWHLGMDTSADHTSDAVVDFDATIFLGSGLTESGGQISVGANGAGLYFVSFSASNMNQDVNDHDLKIRVNGSVINDTRRYSNFLSSQTIGYPDSGTFAGVVKVSANQTIDVWGNGDMYGDNMTYFSGFRVGALT